MTGWDRYYGPTVIGSHCCGDPALVAKLNNKNKGQVCKEIEIKRTKSAKSVGVIIDKNLSWKEHIDNNCTEFSKAIGIIRYFSLVINKKDKTNLNLNLY